MGVQTHFSYQLKPNSRPVKDIVLYLVKKPGDDPLLPVYRLHGEHLEDALDRDHLVIQLWYWHCSRHIYSHTSLFYYATHLKKCPAYIIYVWLRHKRGPQSDNYVTCLHSFNCYVFWILYPRNGEIQENATNRLEPHTLSKI